MDPCCFRKKIFSKDSFFFFRKKIFSKDSFSEKMKKDFRNLISWPEILPTPAVHLMDEFGRQTMIICPRWTEVDGGRRRTVHLMDGFRRRTIRNLKMWTEVDGWTDGRKSVRGGLVGPIHHLHVLCRTFSVGHNDF